MLDQNTDRMWYVIGAVLIGAAIIFGMNTMMPNAFASVGANFQTLMDSVNLSIDRVDLDEVIVDVDAYEWAPGLLTVLYNSTYPDGVIQVEDDADGYGEDNDFSQIYRSMSPVDVGNASKITIELNNTLELSGRTINAIHTFSHLTYDDVIIDDFERSGDAIGFIPKSNPTYPYTYLHDVGIQYLEGDIDLDTYSEMAIMHYEEMFSMNRIEPYKRTFDLPEGTNYIWLQLEQVPNADYTIRLHN